MRKVVVALVLVLGCAGAAEAQKMPVSQFLAKADALQKKGALALLSSDIGLLKREIQNSAKQLRAEQIAAQKAGRKTSTCMPAKASMNSNELLAHFRSIPPQQRNMSVKAGLMGLMQKKFPCP